MDRRWAVLLLNIIDNVDCPAIMYEGEKDTLKKGLHLILNEELKN